MLECHGIQAVLLPSILAYYNESPIYGYIMCTIKSIAQFPSENINFTYQPQILSNSRSWRMDADTRFINYLRLNSLQTARK
jgi:hypothetical protein